MINKRAIYLSLILLLAAQNTQAIEHCTSSNYPFVSCPNTIRNFQSVILAIHGWNGSCESTFGEGSGSIYRILNVTKFFDIDCFQYDSLETSLNKNVRLLREHILKLNNRGYRNVMLVTHSTGGVIALKLLTDIFLESNNALKPNYKSEALQDPNQIWIQSIQAWATPINGVRSHIQHGGKLLKLVGYSPETLPDLRPGSQFLTNLKNRLRILDELYNNSDANLRGRLDLYINYYQGQGDDKVVFEISPVAARQEGWLWKGRSDVITTGMGHTHNVAESGKVLEPLFPAFVMHEEALISLPLTPRYDDVFPIDLPVIPESLEMRQKEVINALIFYSRRQFSYALFPAIEFLHRVFNQAYNRSGLIDKLLVQGLVNVIEEKSGDPNDALINFLMRFVHGVLSTYDPSGGENIKRFGYQQSDIVINILEMTRIIHDAVINYLSKQSIVRQKILIAPYTSLAEFNIAMHEIISRFYDSNHWNVKTRTLANVKKVIDQSTRESIEKSLLVDKTLTYYSENYSLLDADSKKNVGDILIAAFEQSDSVRHELNKKLVRQVNYLNRDLPLWVTLADDRIISEMVNLVASSEDIEKEDIIFMLSVAQHGAASGNNYELASAAAEHSEQILTSPDHSQSDYTPVVESAARAATYPSVSRTLNDTARAIRINVP